MGEGACGVNEGNSNTGGGALIVEDHPLYRNGLVSLLAPLFGAHGVRVAQSAEEGLRLAAEAPAPRVIVLDPGLPRMNGVEAVSAFARACPNTPIVAVSASDDRREVAAALLGLKGRRARRPAEKVVLRVLRAATVRLAPGVAPDSLKPSSFRLA